MNARDRTLAKIRKALEGEERPAPTTHAYQRELPHTELVPLLTERLRDYKAVVHHGDPAPYARELGRLAAPPGLPAAWTTGADVTCDDPPLTAAALDALDGVITGCAVAIAETGTLVLDASPDQGRRALTLIPDHHLCVVRPDRIVGTVPEALPRLDPSRPLTWISGPSATSDIELDRIEGVHGPRTLEVVIL